jgi:LPXTG-motif cell wall-anchored protein
MTTQNIIAAIIALAALIAGGAFISFKIRKKNSNNKIVNQNNNAVSKGDIVAGDKTTTNK